MIRDDRDDRDIKMVWNSDSSGYVAREQDRWKKSPIFLPFTFARSRFFSLTLQFFIKSTKRVIYKGWLDTKMIWNAELQHFNNPSDYVARGQNRWKKSSIFFSFTLVCFPFRSIIFTIFHRVQRISEKGSGILNCNSYFYNPSGYVAREQNRYRRSFFLSRSFVLDLSLQFRRTRE